MRAEQAETIFKTEHLSKEFALGASLLDRLTGSVRTLRAVDDVTLDIRRGEIFGVIGESGSGKSTLGYLLALLETPTLGEIIFDGARVASFDARNKKVFRQRVQLVFQDSTSSLNPRRVVGTAIRDALRLRGVKKSDRDNELNRLLSIVGIPREFAERFPQELSGGQRQRIGIARALAMDPEVIIADEPVSSLDVSLQGQIINLLINLQKDFGLTIILISHDIAIIRHVSTRVAVIFGGKVVEFGEVDEVIDDAKHPYTQELLAAVPKGLEAGSITTSFRETPDEGVIVGSGCKFAGRCRHVHERCLSEPPPNILVSRAHAVLCNLYEAHEPV